MVTIRQAAPLFAGAPTVAMTVADLNAPTSPVLTATPISSSQIDLSWTAASDTSGLTQSGVASYKLRRGGSLIATVNAPTTTYENTRLTADTSYSYTVAAVDAAGNESAQSATATARTSVATSGWPVMAPSYVPVVRGLAGPGLDTPAGSGRGGTGTPVIYLVSSTSDVDGGLTQVLASPRIYRGSLRAALNSHSVRTNPAAGPSAILFESSGTCTASTWLRSSNGNGSAHRPYLTIAGQTAPSPGFQIRGYGLLCESAHTLLQHLTIRMAAVNDGEDCFRAGRFWDSAVLTGIVLDHLTLGFAADETIDFSYVWNNATVSHCILHDPLTDASPSGGGSYGFGSLINESATTSPSILFYGNLFHTCMARQPYLRARNSLVANNYLYNWRAPSGAVDPNAYGVIYQSDTNPIGSGVLKNVMRRGPSSVNTFYPVRMFPYVSSGTQIYVGGNYTHATTPADSDLTQFTSMVSWDAGSAGSPTRAASPPYMPAAFVAVDASTVIDLVTATAGSRPGERADATTLRVISEALSNYSTNPQSVGSSGGGHVTVGTADVPTLNANTHNLYTMSGGLQELIAAVLPASIHDVNANTGYTYFEDWLHAKEDAVL